MARAPRQRKARSVFVICEGGSDVKVLTAVLQDLGLQRLTVEDAAGAYGSIVAGTRELISSADLICAVLQEQNSPDVYLELGYALGLGRPIVVIGESTTLPAGASDQFWIRATLNDRRALSFQIQAFLENLIREKPRRHESIDLKPRSTALLTPLHAGQNQLVSDKLLGSWKPESEIERELLIALARSVEVASIMPQPQGPDRTYIPDFAVWLASAQRGIGSPVVIDVGGGHLRTIDSVVERIRRYANAGEVPTGLIIVSETRELRIRVASVAPLIFVLGLREALELLTSGHLIETLYLERSRFVHSAG